ncbi:MAG TPA: LON peptidase substrate-binding domain-containing protein, partial [Myxococcota bacterium]|nr:LON peptidase substrate-binding domain-containing protein [Myxococcota bacterium]
MPEAEAKRSLEFGGERIEVPALLPVLPVRDAVVFPGVTNPLSIGRPKSLAALDAAGQGGFLVVATQRDASVEDPGVQDLHPVACIVRVVRIVDARREGKQAVVVGVARTRMGEVVATEPALRVRIEPFVETGAESPERTAAWRRVVELAQKVIEVRDDLPDEWKGFVAGIP